MKDLRPVKGKYYIRRLIDEGEHLRQDFKYAITDARKIARTISAFANNAGGHLLVGVKDNGVIAGVRSEEDIFVVEQAASMYCRPEQPLAVTAFACGDGLTVLKVEVAPAPERPVTVDEGDGRHRAYYRVADENIVAHPLMVEGWRRARLPRATTMSLSGPERMLLEQLDGAAEGLSVEEFARLSHISMTAASEAVVNLYNLHLITFKHEGGEGFRLFAADTPKP